MTRNEDVKNPSATVPQNLLGCPLATLAVEKEIHNKLRHLERHLDAFLLIEQLKQQFKGKEPLEGVGSSQLSGVASLEDRVGASVLNEWLDNDPEVVETAFRRHMVEEVYKDLDKPECLERLDMGAPQTAELIQQLRAELQGDKSLQLQDLRDLIDKKYDNKTRHSPQNPSLLSKVLGQTTHPLLQAAKPGPWEAANPNPQHTTFMKEVVSDGSNLNIQLRNYSDNPDKISVRLEGVVAAPLICILSVLNEVDHFSNWVPYFTKPFKDACFEVFAVDDFERNSQIVVKMITLDNAYKTPRQTMTIPDPARRVERILVDGSLVIKPLSSESSLLSLLWHENCGMRIPVFMLDFATKQALQHNYTSPPFE